MIRLRLSILMFLQYGMLGLWAITLVTFLKASPHEGGLNLNGPQVAAIYATIAIGATIAPMIIGLIADSLFATHKVLATLHFVAAILLWLVYQFCCSSQAEAKTLFEEQAQAASVPGERQTLWNLIVERDSLAHSLHHGPSATTPEFDTAAARLRDLNNKLPEAIDEARQTPELIELTQHVSRTLFALLLAHNLCFLPTLTLSNAIAFRNLAEPGKQFVQVRVWGTIGYMAAGWLVGLLFPAVSSTPLAVSAIGSAILAAQCLFLPNNQPKLEHRTVSDMLGLPALRLLTETNFRTFAMTSLAISFTMAFHNMYSHPCLVGLQVDHAAVWLTLAQVTEIFCMLAIPKFCALLGTRKVMAIGAIASAIRFLAYAAGLPWFIALGLPFHGIGFTLFNITGSIFVDRRTPKNLHASAQGLMAMITAGGGSIAGNWFASQVVDNQTTDGMTNWFAVWMVPAIAGLLAGLFFATFFRDDGKTRGEPISPPLETIEPPA